MAVNPERRESFQQLRDFCQRIAEENGCTLKISHGINKRVHFELFPEGSPYGALLRAQDRRMNDVRYIDHLLEQEEFLVESIHQIVARRAEFEEEASGE